MATDKALHIIRELMATAAPEEFNYSFPKIVTSFDLSTFVKQACDNLDGVDFEYIDQRGDGEMHPHHGQVAYKLFEDTFLVIDFFE